MDSSASSNIPKKRKSHHEVLSFPAGRALWSDQVPLQNMLPTDIRTVVHAQVGQSRRAMEPHPLQSGDTRAKQANTAAYDEVISNIRNDDQVVTHLDDQTAMNARSEQVRAGYSRVEVQLERVIADGDVELLFRNFLNEDGKPLALLVSRETISRCSEFFQAIFTPGSRWMLTQESLKNGTPQVDMLDDNYQAMEIIMNALHHKRRSVPTKPSFKILGQIALLCDKYALLEALGMWPETWVQPHLENIDDSEHVAWLFIAGAFGMKKVLQRSLQFIVVDSKMDHTTGELVYSSGHVFSTGVSGTLINRITDARKAALQVIRDFVLVQHHELQHGIGTHCLEQAVSGPDEEDLPGTRNTCKVINLGCIANAFPDLLNGNDDKERFFTVSIKSILDRVIKSPNMQTMDSLCAVFLHVHGGCDVALSISAMIAKVIVAARYHILEDTKNHDIFTDTVEESEALEQLLPEHERPHYIQRRFGKSWINWDHGQPHLYVPSPFGDIVENEIHDWLPPAVEAYLNIVPKFRTINN